MIAAIARTRGWRARFLSMRPYDMASAQRRGRIITSNDHVARDAEASRREARALVAELQAKERLLLERIVAGGSLAAVAAELGETLDEAGRLKASVMTKLGAATTADLVRVGLYAEVDADL